MQVLRSNNKIKENNANAFCRVEVVEVEFKLGGYSVSVTRMTAVTLRQGIRGTGVQ